MACIPLVVCIGLLSTFLLLPINDPRSSAERPDGQITGAMGAENAGKLTLGSVSDYGERNEGNPEATNPMPENLSNIIIVSIFMGLGALAMVSIIGRMVKDHFAPIRTVQAVVIDKHKAETFSKYSGNGKSEKYVIVFSVDGKKKSFYVSQFSYGGYKINEKGTLTYKGSRLISFQ